MQLQNFNCQVCGIYPCFAWERRQSISLTDIMPLIFKALATALSALETIIWIYSICFNADLADHKAFPWLILWVMETGVQPPGLYFLKYLLDYTEMVLIFAKLKQVFETVDKTHSGIALRGNSRGGITLMCVLSFFPPLFFPRHNSSLGNSRRPEGSAGGEGGICPLSLMISRRTDLYYSGWLAIVILSSLGTFCHSIVSPPFFHIIFTNQDFPAG